MAHRKRPAHVQFVDTICFHGRCVLKRAKHHVYPCAENNHHPHILHHKSLLITSVGLILLKLFVIGFTIFLPSQSVYSTSLTIQNLFTLTNAARAQANLPAYSLNAKLNWSAQAKADDMAKHGYFSHVGPDGKTAYNWIRMSGYGGKYMGENLAVHYTASEEAQQGWLASPMHRANILHSTFTDVGIGISQGVFENAQTFFIVEHFGGFASSSTIAPAPQPLPSSTSRTSVSTSTIESVTGSLLVSTTHTKQLIAAAVTSSRVATPLLSSVVTASTKTTSTRTAVIQATNLRVKPNGALEVQLQTQHASSVLVHVNNVTQALAPSPLLNTTDTNAFIGTVAIEKNTTSDSEQPVIAIATNAYGETMATSVGIITPNSTPASLYDLNLQPRYEWSIFQTWTIRHLNDITKAIYVFFLALLTAVLLLNIIIKVHQKHVSVIVHTFFTIGITSLLLLL